MSSCFAGDPVLDRPGSLSAKSPMPADSCHQRHLSFSLLVAASVSERYFDYRPNITKRGANPFGTLTPFGSPDRPRIFNSRMNLARRLGIGPPPFYCNEPAATPAQPSRDPPRRGFVQSDARADGPERPWLTLNVGQNHNGARIKNPREISDPRDNLDLLRSHRLGHGDDFHSPFFDDVLRSACLLLVGCARRPCVRYRSAV